MINNIYTKAYTEVLEIIKHFPENEYNKIPKEKIEYYKKNMDKEYSFTIDPSIELSEQNISKEASAIIVTLFRDYFSTEEQKEKLDELIKLNEKKMENEKRKKYDPGDIFKNKIEKKRDNNQEVVDEMQPEPEITLVEYKENFFIKFKNFVLRLLNIKS